MTTSSAEREASIVRIVSMTPDEKLSPAAELAAMKPGPHREEHQLLILVELGFAIAKGGVR
jgi:hypothetical protein